MLVTARVAEVHVGADEALLVAQQDHNLCRESRGRGGEGESVIRRKGDATCTHAHVEGPVRGARTCCGGSCPLLPQSPDPPALCWVHWC